MLPRLRTDLVAEAHRENGRLVYAIAAPGSAPMRITDRVYSALLTLNQATTLDDWCALVRAREPGISRAQLEQLLSSAGRAGWTEARPVVVPATEPTGFDDDHTQLVDVSHLELEAVPPPAPATSPGPAPAAPASPAVTPPAASSAPPQVAPVTTLLVLNEAVEGEELDDGNIQLRVDGIDAAVLAPPQLSMLEAFDGATSTDEVYRSVIAAGVPLPRAMFDELLRQMIEARVLLVSSIDAAVPPRRADEGDDGAATTDGWQAASDVAASGDAKRRRWTRRLRRLAPAAALFAALVVTAVVVRVPLRITYECELFPLDRRVVRAPVEGVIGDITVSEGQAVKKGDVLGHLANAELKLNVIKSRAALDKARAELQLLLEGSREEELNRARARVNGAYNQLRLAQARVERRRREVKSGVAPRDELDRAESERASLAGQLAQARAELKLLMAGSRNEEILRMEAEVQSLEAQLDVDERLLAASELRAEMDGVIATARPQDKRGARVAAGEAILEIVRSEKMRVDVLVAERDFDVLEVGLPVRVKVPAYPTAVFEGEVTKIAQTIERNDWGNIVRVEGVLGNEQGLLVPNMTGYAEITTGERPLLQVLVRRLVRFIRVRFLI